LNSQEKSDALATPLEVTMRRPTLFGVPETPILAAPLVVRRAQVVVATASLQVRPDAPECGWVCWVATDRERRREGLARALVINLLAMARQAGCREVRLRTQADRLAAIQLYLQLGFEQPVPQ